MGEGLNRRELLKRGAILGVVWATPAVQAVSMVSSAAAAASGDLCPVQLTFNGVFCNVDDTKYLEWQFTNMSGEPLYVRLRQFSDCIGWTDDAWQGGLSNLFSLPAGASPQWRPSVYGTDTVCTMTLEIEVYRCTGAGPFPLDPVSDSCELLCTLRDTQQFTVSDCTP